MIHLTTPSGEKLIGSPTGDYLIIPAARTGIARGAIGTAGQGGHVTLWTAVARGIAGIAGAGGAVFNKIVTAPLRGVLALTAVVGDTICTGEARLVASSRAAVIECGVRGAECEAGVRMATIAATSRIEPEV